MIGHRLFVPMEVKFIEDPTDYGKHRIATLKDPEGNVIQLLERTG